MTDMLAHPDGVTKVKHSLTRTEICQCLLMWQGSQSKSLKSRPSIGQFHTVIKSHPFLLTCRCKQQS